MVYMTASVKLYAGKLEDFISLLNDIQPMLAKHGWKLMGSYATIVGRLNSVVDFWQLPEPNAVEKALLDPEFQKFIPRIKEIVEDETLSILTKLPIG
ncbi:MAG TPA: NIPSNAP family protein [Candidatus Binataceae bacterium]|nr:NIPSNAP family protein [Candidatus Binataceae bacterium]